MIAMIVNGNASRSSPHIARQSTTQRISVRRRAPHHWIARRSACGRICTAHMASRPRSKYATAAADESVSTREKNSADAAEEYRTLMSKTGS